MEILAPPPFSTASVVWQPRPGAWVRTVVCKATFRLLPDEAKPARDPDPLTDGDDHWNDDEGRSLHRASDLVPFKRRADIVLMGHAYAPGGRPVPALIARLTAAGVNKAIEVHADRVWTQDRRLREGKPFTKLPLRWERAAGGPDTANPVGICAGARPEIHGQVPIPNLQPPGFHLGCPEDVIPPIGFGPIAPSWPGRRALLHRYAASWDHRTWDTRPLPADIDAAFFNVAPPDQQVDEIQSDEWIVLQNLDAEHARLVTRLPGITLQATIERPEAAAQPLRMRCDTLSIDTDRGVCNLVWRGQVALMNRDERIRVVITTEGRGRGREEASPPVRDDPAETMLLTPVVDRAPALPFQEGRSPWAAAPPVPAEKTPPKTMNEESGSTAALFVGSIRTGPALPFSEPKRAGPAPPMAALAPMPAERPSAPPPMIGPLPMVRGPAPLEAVSKAPEAPEPKELPIEEAATIAAEIAEGRAPRSDVLRGHDLTERAWIANERRWARAMEEETANGSSRLRTAYDQAYVGAVERFRGPITLSEYSRIVIGLERGRANQVLDDLEIQRPALMLIVRLWTKKVAKDAKLADEARTLLARIANRAGGA